MRDLRDYREMDECPEYEAPIWSDDPSRRILNPDALKWSGKKPPPPIGAEVLSYLNGFGTGTVLTYFTEYGWLGVLVQFHKPPKWFVEQNNGNIPAHCFGVDFDKPVKK